jgi:hypothetical protein
VAKDVIGTDMKLYHVMITTSMPLAGERSMLHLHRLPTTSLAITCLAGSLATTPLLALALLPPHRHSLRCVWHSTTIAAG